jgi:predicted ester cyclase
MQGGWDMGTDLETNKQLVRDWIEAIERRDIDQALTYATEDYIWQGMAPQGWTRVQGKENFRVAVWEFLDAMPDLKIDILDMVAEGDRVAIRLREVGHHTGIEWCGVQPAGARVEWFPFDFYRIQDGLIAEEWFTDDPYTIFKCLGIKTIE